jgi:stage II sporulation protein AA (anti-sigma F factor antagonist)
MESGFGVEVHDVDGVAGACRIAIQGPLDARNVVAFKSDVAKLQERGMTRFILDLTDVKFVNSTGLSFLINLSESAGEGLQAVTLVGVQPKIKIVFDTMSVSDFFLTAPTVAAAVQALKKKPAMAAAAAAPSRPATRIKREHSSTKTGRVSPPTDHKPPPGFFTRVWRRMFGR